MFTSTQNLALSDEQMVRLTCNALYVAGLEMGAEGDHWPVIKDTIRHVMDDWEKLKIERAVFEELKTHLYANLEKMEAILPTCTPEEQIEAGPKIKRLREIYDAYFTNVDKNMLYLDEADVPAYVKRAEAIIDTLEKEDA